MLDGCPGAHLVAEGAIGACDGLRFDAVRGRPNGRRPSPCDPRHARVALPRHRAVAPRRLAASEPTTFWMQYANHCGTWTGLSRRLPHGRITSDIRGRSRRLPRPHGLVSSRGLVSDVFDSELRPRPESRSEWFRIRRWFGRLGGRSVVAVALLAPLGVRELMAGVRRVEDALGVRRVDPRVQRR